MARTLSMQARAEAKRDAERPREVEMPDITGQATGNDII